MVHRPSELRKVHDRARRWKKNFIAALTNLARIGSRDHWVSDTVAGSLLGYGLGRVFWESSRSRSKYAPRVLLTPQGVGQAWQTY